jgi:hypothetical protein
MKHLSLILIILQLIFISCDKDSIEPNPIEPKPIETKLRPGSFAITALRNPTTKQEPTQHDLKSVAIDYYLGDIKGTTNYSFILLNGGEQPIFDIKLFIQNPAFSITPGNISLLDINNSFINPSGQSMIPIISLNVTHGTHSNGIWYADILPIGHNSGVLKIYGKTLDGTDTIPVSAEFDFIVNAKVMDINLYFDNAKVPLQFSGISNDAIGRGLNQVRVYNVTDNTKVEIENIGNVDIGFNFGPKYILLKPNERKELELHDLYVANERFVRCRLDGGKTITDSRRIDLCNDGYGHFVIHSN